MGLFAFAYCGHDGCEAFLPIPLYDAEEGESFGAFTRATLAEHGWLAGPRWLTTDRCPAHPWPCLAACLRCEPAAPSDAPDVCIPAPAARCTAPEPTNTRGAR